MYAANHRSTGYRSDTTGPTGDVRERWSIERNSGIASECAPVVVDGVVYCGWDDGILGAYDVESGEELWEYQYEGWQASVQTTPLVVEDTVYVGFTRAVSAFDVEDGTRRWSTEVDDVPFHPQFYDGSIYATNGYPGADAARILRFDPDDGTRTVVHEFDRERISQTLAIAGNVAYVGVDDVVVAIDLDSGEELWRWRHPEGDPTFFAGPSVANGTVYASSSYVTHLYDIDLPGCFAIDAETGQEEWRFTPDTPALRTGPAVADGVVYVGEHDLWAVDADSGEELWTVESQPTDAKPAVDGDTVYVWGSEIAAVDAAEGTVDWTYEAQRSGIDWSAPPVIHDDALVLAYWKNLSVLERA